MSKYLHTSSSRLELPQGQNNISILILSFSLTLSSTHVQKSEILVRRDILLKEFYYMKQVAGTDASLEPEPDFAKIDEAKLKAFQEQHQLSEYGLFDSSPPLPLRSTSKQCLNGH